MAPVSRAAAATADDGEVGAIAQHVGAAELEDVAFRQEVRHADAAQTQEHRAVVGGRPGGRRRRLDAVGGRDDRHIRQRPDPGEVLDRVVRRSELAIGHAGTDAAELHIGLRVGDVGLDLLERAAGEEARGAADERDLAAVGEPGAGADEVLLGDADVDQALREAIAETVQLRGADRVVADRDDVAVGLGQCHQRRREGVPAVVQLRRRRAWRRRALRNRRAAQETTSASSARASSYCSALGTL